MLDRERIKLAITDSILRVYDAGNTYIDIHRNTLDIFSASIDALTQNISLANWTVQEQQRQIQKTKQNAIGSLHEDILSSIPGVIKRELTGGGDVFDIISDRHKIIAEVKNKHNTTKGNHKIAIYDDLEIGLKNHPGFIAYYVEILPSSSMPYNVPFTPPDNRNHSRRPFREDIRVIDGKSFYTLLTGDENALWYVYDKLPIIISEILYEERRVYINPALVKSSEHFIGYFKRVYG